MCDIISKGNLLYFSMLGKFSADDILKYFSYFSQKLRFDISCKFSQDNLHELSNLLCANCFPISWGGERNIINLSCAEFVQRVEKVNTNNH